MNSIMNNIAMFFVANWPFLLIVLLAILLAVGAVIAVQNNGIQVISSATKILDYICSKFKELNLEDSRFAFILSIFSQALIYTMAISTLTSVTDKTAAAIQFIKDLCTAFGYKVTDTEYSIMELIFPLVFEIISSMKFKFRALKVNNIKYSIKSVRKLQNKKEIMYKWNRITA